MKITWIASKQIFLFLSKSLHTVKPPTQNILFMKVSWNYRELSYIVEQATLPKQQYVLK